MVRETACGRSAGQEALVDDTSICFFCSIRAVLYSLAGLLGQKCVVLAVGSTQLKRMLPQAEAGHVGLMYVKRTLRVSRSSAGTS